MANGKCEAYEFDEQQLLDFFTCGAVVAWCNAMKVDLVTPRPPHHQRWAEVDEENYAAYIPEDPNRRDEEREQLFRIVRKKSTGDIVGYRRLQVPQTLVVLHPAADTVGVANGGLGYQILEILLGRYPEADVRTIGSGTLKEQREAFDMLLPKALRKKAEKLRMTADDSDASALDDSSVSEEEQDGDTATSKSAAKDANAKFDAHRIAYALADAEAAKRFHRCTLRDRDWAAVNVAYMRLERARKSRVASEQQFRQTHRTELRRLVQDTRVPYVTLGVGDEDDQRIDALLASYESTLRIAVTSDAAVMKKMAKLRAAHTRIVGDRAHEEEMDRHLEAALRMLPEYTEFLTHVKAKRHPESGLPLGKYIGERIFGRLIAGFGSPMSARANEPERASDLEAIAECKQALTAAIAAMNRTGLPKQPPIGDGRTREWLLACERIVRERRDATSSDDELHRLHVQATQVAAARDAYRKFVNARKRAAARPRNRAIAFMGLHVRQGGKYAGTPKDREFPRRRKGGRANWNENLLRQAVVQWVTGIITRGDSHWKGHTYQPTKDRRLKDGEAKLAAQRDAFWRTATVATRWLLDEWFAWERARMAAADVPAAA